MAEEEKMKEEGMEQDYLDTIKQLKESTVSKEEYNKLKEENKKLLGTILEGGELEGAKAQEPKKSASELRKELFSEDADNFTNIKFIQTALKLREAVMEEGGIDPFVPQGERIAPTDDDYEKAQKVADAFQHCLNIANGDNSIFLRELDRITVENAPASVRARQNQKKRGRR